MILNLTQHNATPDQEAAGVRDLPPVQRSALNALLTFAELPSQEEILARAADIAELACFNGLGGDEDDDPVPTAAMIGGALWLMSPLAAELRARGIAPQFAFSTRQSVESIAKDGTVVKSSVFCHQGWIPAL